MIDDTVYYIQNEIAMDEVQPSHSRQSKTEYMDLKEVTAFESKRKEARGAARGNIFARHLAAHQRIWN